MIAPYAEPRQGPRAKIERAKEHLAEFERTILALHGGADLYTAVGKEELRDGWPFVVWRFKVQQSAPARLSAIAGDVVHNARSALDLIAGQCLVAGGSIDHSRFPFGKSLSVFADEVKKQRRNLKPSAIRFVKRLKPYSGGNGTLWLLHALDLLDKHRLLVVVGAVNSRIMIHPNVKAGEVPFLQLTRKRTGALNDGDEFFATPILPEPFKDVLKYTFTFEVRLGSVEGVPEEAAFTTLTKLVRYAEKIVTIAERRLY